MKSGCFDLQTVYLSKMYTLSLQAMEASGKMTFLIDGFPRNKDNLDGWNTAMSEVAEVKKVLFFSCSEQVSNKCMSPVMRKPTFWFSTWCDTNQAVHLHRMARGLKFRI